MPTRTSEAKWTGSLHEGEGNLTLGSGEYEGQYTFASRFKDEEGTNPEELIGAAESGCFSMALSMMLGEEGYTPDYIHTKSKVHIDPEELEITRIMIETEAEVEGIDQDEFIELAMRAKEECPVSKVLGGTRIDMEANLS